MIEVRCKNNWKNMINEQQLQKILKSFIKILFKKDYRISLYVTDDTEIQKLNKQFRNQDNPTDILSWSYEENVSKIDKNIIIESQEKMPSGELVVSAERVLEQSKKNGWDFKTELIRLLAHGCVHLSGLDHEVSPDEEAKMIDLEITLLKKVGLSNIY